MKFLALETDIEKIKRQFCTMNECHVHQTRYHGLSFLFAIIREVIITLVLFGIGVGAALFGIPMFWVLVVLVVIWVCFVFFNVLKAYIDWCFDLILITTDKVILIDQTSIFKQEVKPIHIENIGSISTETQFWNLFPFGIIRINLKEGEGGDTILLRYVPNADDVAAKITDVLTQFQRDLAGGNR